MACAEPTRFPQTGRLADGCAGCHRSAPCQCRPRAHRRPSWLQVLPIFMRCAEATAGAVFHLRSKTYVSHCFCWSFPLEAAQGDA